jgi:predicted nucleotidyltransferase
MKLIIDNKETGLKENEIEEIKKIFESFPEVEEAVLFGSRAKGNYKPGSDIDISLKGIKLTHNILNKISNSLDDLLLPFFCELSIYDRIKNRDLIDHINRVGIIVYKKLKLTTKD